MRTHNTYVSAEIKKIPILFGVENCNLKRQIVLEL